MIERIVLALATLMLAAAAHGAETPTTEARFLALGDSYTIGEGVAPPQRWPAQLGALLRAQGVALAEPEYIARTGWTTDELAAGIAAAAPRGPYALVTLQIGVNDQFRGHQLADFRRELAGLLATAVALAGGEAPHVLVLSIPDWGVTPFAAGRDRAAIASAIDAFNAVGRDEAGRAGARWSDVTALSRAITTDGTARDGLHPSAAAYARWAESAVEAAARALAPR